MDVKEKVKSLPLSPGVYLMKDSSGSIIYVGKSKSLKNRVSSYFHSSKNRSSKVEKLVKNLKDFEYILTDTEFEAFMLECRLIKDLKPIYNKKMKSPLSYTYIKINPKEQYNSIQISSEYIQDDGNLYFGPYTSKNTVEKAVQGIKEFFKLHCSSSLRTAAGCLNYSLGLCLGMCLGDAEKAQYSSIIHRIIMMLGGEDRSVIEEMEAKMNEAAERFDFETAAKCRDYVSSINYLLSSEKIIAFTEENKNIAMLELIDTSTAKFFLIKGNKVLSSKKYDIENINSTELKALFENDIFRFFNNEAYDLPSEVSKDDIDEAHIIYSYLKSSNCSYIIIPDEWLNEKDAANIGLAIDSLLA